MNKNKFEYLRLSVINVCNLRCLYCKSENQPFSTDIESISLKDIETLIRFFVRIGTKKLRITGGEPLLREDIDCIIKIATSFPEIKDIGLTTNGVLLEKRMSSLLSAGLKRINISLPSLNPERYKRITGMHIQPVLNGIDSALNSGINVKLNMVAYDKNIIDELNLIIDFISDKRLELRFIEYMPLCSENYHKENFVDPSIIEKKLVQNYRFLYNNLNNQIVSRIYTREDVKGRIGFIKPVTNPFCDFCNKIRINCYGMLIPCLFSNNSINILGLIKNNPFEQARDGLDNFIKLHFVKPDIKSIFEGRLTSSKRMSEIGG